MGYLSVLKTSDLLSSELWLQLRSRPMGETIKV